VEGRPPAEQDLIARATRGDGAAYAELVEEHQTIAFRTAFLIVGDAAEAEDVTQEAFIKAYAALGRFRRGAPFRPWILRIVANEARNRRKGGQRRAALALRAAEQVGAPLVAPPAESAVLAADQRATLLEAVNRLREDDRLVIACRYFLDLGEEETASALGCARGTVKSRTSRALERLRAELEGAT
jgi:RNA polymerase sigma-70 factor (ECF subfamily)